MTDHQLSLLSFLLTLIVVVIAPLWVWLSQKLDLVSNKQMLKDLDRIRALGIAAYAEKVRKNSHRCMCIAAYLICWVIMLQFSGWPGMRPLQIIFTAIATVLTGATSIYGDAATPLGVEGRKNRLRKCLGLPEEE